MKRLTVIFSIQTKYGCLHSESVTIEVDIDASENEINEEINARYRLWLEVHNYGGWEIIKTETI